jgi:hypothetical protein
MAHFSDFSGFPSDLLTHPSLGLDIALNGILGI